MFDPGITEVVLIMVVALLVVGPQRLPGLARKVGLWVGKARSYLTSVRSDIERELQAEELKRMLQKQESELRELRDMVNESSEDIRSEVEDTEYLVKAMPSDSQPEKPPQGTDQEQDTDTEQRTIAPAAQDDAKQ